MAVHFGAITGGGKRTLSVYSCPDMSGTPSSMRPVPDNDLCAGQSCVHVVKENCLQHLDIDVF